jgi:hypothetical protein
MIKRYINIIASFLIKKTCSHKDKKEAYVCYQDRYVKYYCPDCKEYIYEEL